MSKRTASTDGRNLAMLAHLLGIVTGFIGCLIIWRINKDKPEKTFVNDQAREALNFQVTICLAFLVVFILVAFKSMFILIGFILLPVLVIVDIVFCIIAGIAASNGRHYRYPFTLSLLR